MQTALFEISATRAAPKLSLEGAVLLQLFAYYPGKSGFREAQCLCYLLGEAGFSLGGRFELVNQTPESKAVSQLLRDLDKGGYLLGYHPQSHMIGHLRVAQDALEQVNALVATFPKAQSALSKVLEWTSGNAPHDLHTLAKFHFLAKENHLECPEALVAHLKATRQHFYPDTQIKQFWGKVTTLQA